MSPTSPIPLVWILVRREFRQLLRDRTALILAIIAPVGAALIASISVGAPRQVRTTIAIVGPPGLHALIEREIGSTPGNEVAVRVVNTEAEARNLVRRGKVATAVVIPASPSDSPLVIASRSEAIPEAVTRDLARLAQVAATKPGSLAALERKPVVTASYTRTLNGAELYGPVIAIPFLFLVTGVIARSLQGERVRGTLQRMRSTSVSANAILASKAIMIVVLGCVEMIAIMVALSLVLGARWGNPLIVFAILFAVTLVVSATALIVAATVSSPAQAQAIEVFLLLALTALGGNFIPLENLPRVAQIVSPFTPNGAAIHALRQVATGGGIADVVKPLAAILGLALILGSLGFARARAIVNQ